MAMAESFIGMLHTSSKLYTTRPCKPAQGSHQSWPYVVVVADLRPSYLQQAGGNGGQRDALG